MADHYPQIPFERYADDAICHCESAEEAQALWSALADRFAACKLVLHPDKTKIVYCQDKNRRWTLHHRSDKALADLATLYDPYIRGWIAYYGSFYRTQLRPTLNQDRSPCLSLGTPQVQAAAPPDPRGARLA